MAGKVPLLTRFFDKISPEPNSGCWLWLGSVDSRGYGYIAEYVAGEKKNLNHLAHRLSYRTLIGPIGDDLHLDHLCRVTVCVNPRHLEPVTCRTNILRGLAPQAGNAKKTHCKRGHLLSGGNLLGGQGAHRRCRICHREYVARRRRDRRALEK